MKLGKQITSSIAEKLPYAGLVDEGRYKLRIEKVDYDPSNDSKSNRAIVTFKVIDSDFNGSMIRNVFTIDNPSNPKAEEVSRKLFADMLKSAGFAVEDMSEDFDTDWLIDRTVQGLVTIVPPTSNYPQPSNKVKVFV